MFKIITKRCKGLSLISSKNNLAIVSSVLSTKDTHKVKWSSRVVMSIKDLTKLTLLSMTSDLYPVIMKTQRLIRVIFEIEVLKASRAIISVDNFNKSSKCYSQDSSSIRSLCKCIFMSDLNNIQTPKNMVFTLAIQLNSNLRAVWSIQTISMILSNPISDSQIEEIVTKF